MKSTSDITTLAVLPLCFAMLSGPPGSAFAQAHDHGDAHETREEVPPAPPPGALWETDAALEQGMARVRDAVAAVLPAWHAGELSLAQAAALAGTVEENVAFLVANCKLEPAADAALHGLLAEFMQGASALERDPTSPEGMPRIVAALRAYPERFAHEGWAPLPD